jgi:membrane associated rhomboid family serine protease
LIAANVGVFFYELTLSSRTLDRFFLTWGVIPQNVLAALAGPLAPGSLHVFETLLTSQFIHGGWLHLIGKWFVQQFFYGVLTLTPSAAASGGVAFWAHVGGFLIGMISIVPFIERARRRAQWPGWQ